MKMNVKIKGMNYRSQRGAILMLVLILLTIMSVIGISANRDIILQERMARNELDSNRALQAAEAALRDAESNLGNCAPAETQFSGGTNGYYDVSSNPPADWKVAADYADGSTAWIVTDLTNVNQDPRFRIERLEPVELTGDQDLKLGEPVQSAILFRVVAQGFGSSDKTDAVIQTIRYTYQCTI